MVEANWSTSVLQDPHGIYCQTLSLMRAESNSTVRCFRDRRCLGAVWSCCRRGDSGTCQHGSGGGTLRCVRGGFSGRARPGETTATNFAATQLGETLRTKPVSRFNSHTHVGRLGNSCGSAARPAGADGQSPPRPSHSAVARGAARGLRAHLCSSPHPPLPLPL